MPIFDAGTPAFYGPTTVGTSASVRIWSGTTTALTGTAFSSTVLGPQLRDITILNTGTALCFVGLTGVSITTGTPLAPGQQLTIQNWTATVGTTTSDLFAIASGPATASWAGITYNGGPTTVIAGLATLASVV